MDDAKTRQTRHLTSPITNPDISTMALTIVRMDERINRNGAQFVALEKRGDQIEKAIIQRESSAEGQGRRLGELEKQVAAQTEVISSLKEKIAEQNAALRERMAAQRAKLTIIFTAISTLAAAAVKLLPELLK